MARPTKTNADYFPHDAHMRNDPRILALRRKHGLPGYAVYVMTIEAMSNASHFRLDVSLTGREIISGDFGIDESSLDTILRYCVQIDLFQLSGDVLTCKSLTKRFESLLNRRVPDAETMQKPAVTMQEPYSKVKESKEEKSKVEEITLSDFQNLFDSLWRDRISSMTVHKGKNLDEAIQKAYLHLQAGGRLLNGDAQSFKQCVQAFLNNEKPGGNGKAPRKKAFEI